MRFFSDLWIIITQLYAFHVRVVHYFAKHVDVATMPADWKYHVANLRSAYYYEVTYFPVDLPDNEPNHEPAAYPGDPSLMNTYRMGGVNNDLPF